MITITITMANEYDDDDGDGQYEHGDEDNDNYNNLFPSKKGLACGRGSSIVYNYICLSILRWYSGCLARVRLIFFERI